MPDMEGRLEQWDSKVVGGGSLYTACDTNKMAFVGVGVVGAGKNERDSN